MSDHDPVAWLRAQVEARRDLALLITAPRPHLRDSGARLAGEWRTGCTCKGECGDYPACEEVTGDGIHIYSEGGHDADQAAHIAASDPQDTIARCEAELAILDACTAAIENGRIPPGATWSDDAAGAEVARQVVCLLAGGYRHRPGFPAAFAA